MGMPDKGMNHIAGGTKQDSVRFRPTPQNGVQLKTYELHISGIFYLIVSGCS